MERNLEGVKGGAAAYEREANSLKQKGEVEEKSIGKRKR